MSTETAPARRYSWPPFEPGNSVGERFEDGNQAARTHGAYSDAVIAPRARELAEVILDANPHLDAVRDSAGVWRYAKTMSKIDHIEAYLGEQSDPVFVDRAKGTIHPVVALLLALESRADKAEERLAIAPLTRAKLGLDKLRGLDLASALKAFQEQGGGDGA